LKNKGIYMSKIHFIYLILMCGYSICHGQVVTGSTPNNLEWMDAVLSGGETTYALKNPSVRGFQNPAVNLSVADLEHHLIGDALFEKNFSDNPARSDYGLGPAYNNTSCAACHARDGRGALPVVLNANQWTKFGSNEGLFLRLSIENSDSTNYNQFQDPTPVPGYSGQLFHLGSYNLRPDAPGTGQAELWFKNEVSQFTYPDGTTVQLRKPLFEIRKPYDLKNGQSRLFQSDVKTSPRMTPPMVGLGLIEAILESDIIALSKRDLSVWGIYGRPNWVRNKVSEKKYQFTNLSVGKFGHKASTPTIEQQTAGALNGDMGVTTSLFETESIFGTEIFETYKPFWKSGIEASDEIFQALSFYSKTLAVPGRREADLPIVKFGAQKFQNAGCANCHNPSFITGDHEIKALSYQKIYPYSDFLLHDMGDGLADGRKDYQASGNDWKTKPLWGIGLTQVVNQRAGFLHDGRARTLEEAILWHGGEAEKSKNSFAALSINERQALLSFLKSL
jgi:CxxC motif-containing protein (DUF1111 family)